MDEAAGRTRWRKRAVGILAVVAVAVAAAQAQAVSPPTFAVEPPSSVTQTSATLHATVNPNGGMVSECRFEYGRTTSYGSSAPCTPPPGSGTSPVAVSASITGLEQGRVYHFRISATNPGGTSKSIDHQFKTAEPVAPTVVTEPATSVMQTTATLNAMVNPNAGTVSDCHFEYGTTLAYGSSSACTSTPGSGESPVAVSTSATGLTANVLYHFRISATNPSGTTTGSDQAFKTLPNPPAVVTEGRRP
jgi:phosphodiesterase/alkaline phosphatase D-like protein